jgi:carbon-monoxide dehydrogenase large subunit
VERAKALAAELLEANVDDIVLDDRGFSVVGVPSLAVQWNDVVERSERARPDDAGAEVVPTWRALAEEHDWARVGPTFPFGAHIAVVEVDTDTGKTTLVRHVAIDDCGTVINPLLATGQVHGGIAQGAAQALFEHVRYDDDGYLLTGTLLDYTMPSAVELPLFDTDRTVTPTPLNPLGAKGIGESGTIGATPAVHNAVIDALAHLGVRHLDMPCTPEKVWRAIHDGQNEGGLVVTRR